jgi:hypothetical protein
VRLSNLGAAFALTLSLAGCTPSCETVCDKLLTCDLETDGLYETVCVDSCERQEALYTQWDDEDKLDAYDDHLRCLVRSDCDEIDEGVCYDPLVFVTGSELDDATSPE